MQRLWEIEPFRQDVKEFGCQIWIEAETRKGETSRRPRQLERRVYVDGQQDPDIGLEVICHN